MGGIVSQSHCEIIPPAPTQNIPRGKTSKSCNPSSSCAQQKALVLPLRIPDQWKSMRSPRPTDKVDCSFPGRDVQSNNPCSRSGHATHPHPNALHWTRHRRWERKHFPAKRFDPETKGVGERIFTEELKCVPAFLYRWARGTSSRVTCRHIHN